MTRECLVYLKLNGKGTVVSVYVAKLIIVLGVGKINLVVRV